MPPPVLLCPLSDFPFMLPECVPTGTILALSLPVPVVACLLLVRCWLRGRNTRVLGATYARGVVSSRPEAACFTLHTGQGDVLVCAADAEISRRALRPGQRVAVSGVDAVLAPPGERLFRQPARQSGIDALTVRPLRWWVWEWAVPALLLVGWLSFAGVLLEMTS